jgi:UDP-N-acetylmuramoyl-tripeptide--D-alanyl-D-alanine ligase
MTLWTKKELLAALGKDIIDSKLSEKLTIDEVVIDSRKIVKNGLFIAIKGENNDGHNFLKQAKENGCKTLLIQDKTKIKNLKNIQFILVKDTFKALYKLAKFSRKRSKAKIIGVTGSVGKTTTKEMLRDAFATYGKTFATVGNLNNHFGVPLTLCNFSSDCDYGIFEMGMNHANEITPLSQLVKPHIAVITNVGPAHIENFKNEQGIALAKAEIFAGLSSKSVALINRDNTHYDFLKKCAKEKYGVKNLVSFGEKPSSDYRILEEKILGAESLQITAALRNKEKITYKIPSIHEAVKANSIIVITCIDLLNLKFTKPDNLFKFHTHQAGRGKIIELNISNKKIAVIDDSYNASIFSIHSGLKYANDVKKALKKKRLIVALGDMFELGKESDRLHKQAISYCADFNIDLIFLAGEKMSQFAPAKAHKFADSNSCSEAIAKFLKDGDLLYVKGSRGMKMERVFTNLIKK